MSYTLLLNIIFCMCKFFIKELLTMKSEIRELKKQLNALSPQPPPQPPPQPQPQPPPQPFTDWVQMATDALAESTTKNNGKEWTKDANGKERGKYTCLRDWTSAVDAQKTNESVPDLWVHILNTVKSKNCKDSSREIYIANIMTVARELKIPADVRPDGFITYHTQLQNTNKVSSECNKLSDEQLEAKLRLKDGTLFTTARLRAFCSNVPEDTTDDHQRFNLMFLTMCAYHGNRQQDWMVGYTEEHKTERGYYCPMTAKMHLYIGKNQTPDDPPRIFKVNAHVAIAIDRYHSKLQTPSKHVLPPIMAVKDTNKKVTTLIRNAFPTSKGLNHSDLRDLYETHIRWVEQLDTEVINDLMRQIDHKAVTAWNRYAIKYSGVLDKE